MLIPAPEKMEDGFLDQATHLIQHFYKDDALLAATAETELGGVLGRRGQIGGRITQWQKLQTEFLRTLPPANTELEMFKNKLAFQLRYSSVAVDLWANGSTSSVCDCEEAHGSESSECFD